jgi:protein TonB
MIIRYASAATTGTFITLALFYVMQSLIAMERFEPPPERPRLDLDFWRTVKDTEVKTRELELFKKLKKPVPVDPTGPEFSYSGTGPGISIPTGEVTHPGNKIETLGIFIDGPLVTVVRVEPAYPPAASGRNLEGFVTVQFDVNPDGTVTNVTVVESSSKIFERAAIKAAQKFRFKARVVDGVPQPSYGLQNRFVFKMERA